MNDQLLDLEIRLLVLRHGRSKVLSALARSGEQTPQQLEEQLQALERVPAPTRKQKPIPSIIDVVESESRDRSDIAEPVRALALAFENRSYLPNLRDVYRFLNRTGTPSRKFKSRAAAGPTVIRTLFKLSKDELVNLASRNATHGESDYSILSRAIMGRSSDEEEKKR